MGTDKKDACKAIIAYAVAMRKASGRTTKEIAATAGVKSQYVSRLESGTIDPALTSFINYADSIGCEVQLVRKDGKNDYRRLVEQLLKALENSDKESIENTITHLKEKLYYDKSQEAATEKESIDYVLLSNKHNENVVIFKEDAADTKRLDAYGQQNRVVQDI